MTSQAEVDARNAATSALECATFARGDVQYGTSYLAYLSRDLGPVRGYYVMGQYTSAGWYGPADKAEAEKHAQRIGGRIEVDQPRTHRITTWTGETLATVIAIKFRRDATSWLTDSRGSFWARGIDGRLWHGRHNGVGIYCRMRLSKRQTP